MGPISADTIIKLDAATGEVLDSWGSILFYVPHGMTIDRHGNTWVTDVAQHQVFKFHPNSKYPALTIGRRFQPGSLPNHLCQPTSVAIATTGEVNRCPIYMTCILQMYSSSTYNIKYMDFYLNLCVWVCRSSSLTDIVTIES